jgi:hypothetical protein
MQVNTDLLRKRAEDERRRTIAAAEQRYTADISAIERLEIMASADTSPDDNRNKSPGLLAMGDVNGWPGNRAAIRQAIEHAPERFRLDNIVEYLNRIYPGHSLKRSTLSIELWRMGKHSDITVVKKGLGRKPSIYRKTAKGGEPNETESSTHSGAD